MDKTNIQKTKDEIVEIIMDFSSDMSAGDAVSFINTLTYSFMNEVIEEQEPFNKRYVKNTLFFAQRNSEVLTKMLEKCAAIKRFENAEKLEV